MANTSPVLLTDEDLINQLKAMHKLETVKHDR